MCSPAAALTSESVTAAQLRGGNRRVFVSGGLQCGWGLMVSAALASSVPAVGKPVFPDDPFPRVEVGMHTGFIKKLSVSLDGSQFVTVSDDKTARVWETRSGRLRHVLRAPMAEGFEGRLYAAAISPKGEWVAVGGFTGIGVDRAALIYVFDLRTGRLLGALADLGPTAVENLVFTPDGKVLAVCLADGAGVIFYDWPNQKVITRSTVPTDKVLGAAVAPDGDFALTTIDGVLWLYSADARYENPRRLTLKGEQPMHVQFSPDGRRIAVGFDARPALAIVDVTSLQIERVLELEATERQVGQHVVEWSADGTYLYSAGQPADPDNARIYRWRADGEGAPLLVLTGSRRISDLRRLPTGGFAFSSGAPEVGVVDATGRAIWRESARTVDPGLLADRFLASPDGQRVHFTATPSGQSFLFDLFQRPEDALVRQPASGGSRPRPRATGWAMLTERDGSQFRVNGQPVSLDPAERVRVWSVVPGDQLLVIGTAWSVRLVDRSGRPLWRAEAPEDTRVVLATDDHRFVIAAFADGTVRWYRIDDGAEVLAFLPHRNGTDWVAWIPTGYYMSSVSGDNLIGWHLNNAVDQTPDFYRAVQFERVLYRPDIVREYFRNSGRADVRTLLADANAFRVNDLRRLAPPHVNVEDLAVRPAGAPTARFTLTGRSKSLPIQEFTVFVNDIPVTPWSERTLPPDQAMGFRRNLEVPLTAKYNEIRVEAFNGQSMGVAESVVELAGHGASPPRGDLYLVAIGVNQFVSEDDRVRDLRFAAQDAEELARYFQGRAGTEFDQVYVHLASDNSAAKPVRETVRDLVATIREAGPDDTVIVFLASHGWSDTRGNYFFLPSDASTSDIDKILAGRTDVETLIDWRFFFDEMRRAAGRRLLIVDTCNSGDMRGTFDVHSLAKRSAASRFALVAASKGDELSQEYAAGGHGIFTYGLLQALRDGADKDGDGRTTLREAFDHAFDVVQTTRTRKHLPQTPQFEAPAMLERLVLRSGGATSSSVRDAGNAGAP